MVGKSCVCDVIDIAWIHNSLPKLQLVSTDISNLLNKIALHIITYYSGLPKIVVKVKRLNLHLLCHKSDHIQYSFTSFNVPDIYSHIMKYKLSLKNGAISQIPLKCSFLWFSFQKQRVQLWTNTNFLSLGQMNVW